MQSLAVQTTADFFNGKIGKGPNEFPFLQWEWPVYTGVCFRFVYLFIFWI
jgi:hypothetical protein